MLRLRTRIAPARVRQTGAEMQHSRVEQQRRTGCTQDMHAQRHEQRVSNNGSVGIKERTALRRMTGLVARRDPENSMSERPADSCTTATFLCFRIRHPTESQSKYRKFQENSQNRQ